MLPSNMRRIMVVLSLVDLFLLLFVVVFFVQSAMIRKDFAKESLRLAFPKLAPHKSVSDFFESRKHLNEVQLRAYEWDKSRPDPVLHLTSSRRIYEDTEEVLAEKRKYYKDMRRFLDDQWRELTEKEEELKQSFQELNSFVVTNKDKRERAKERVKEDTKARIIRTEEIEKLQNNLTKVQETKTQMDQEIAKHIFYEKFLNETAESSDSCNNVSDLINRYESLLKTKSELGERQKKFLEDIEQARSNINKINSENRLYILGLHNVLSSLSARYQTATSNSMRWESAVWRIKDNAFKKFQEINEVKQACRNICALMSKRKDESLKMEEENFEKQLAYIKKTLQELKVVTGEAQILSKKTFSSMKGQTSKAS